MYTKQNSVCFQFGLPLNLLTIWGKVVTMIQFHQLKPEDAGGTDNKDSFPLFSDRDDRYDRSHENCSQNAKLW